MTTSGPSAGRKLPINGAQLWVEAAGSGSTVVLIHSGVTDSGMWDPQWSVLCMRHRTIRYDLRGYGRSTLPSAAYAHHDDLRTLLDALEVEQATLVAASMGGEVAIAFALDNPDRADRLVVLNTLAGIDEPSADLRTSWRAMEAALERDDLEGALEIELRMWVDGPYRTPDQVSPAVRGAVRDMDRRLLERAAKQEHAVETEPDSPILDRLGAVRCPTLVITGELDVPEAHRSAERLIRSIPDARGQVIPGVAHFPSMEASDHVNRLIMDFLN